MRRRNILFMLPVGLAYLFMPFENVQDTMAQSAKSTPHTPHTSNQKIFAVHQFSGQGNTKNIDTGLRDPITGKVVSPSFVTITPTDFRQTASVSWHIHTGDTLVDVNISGGLAWTALAYLLR